MNEHSSDWLLALAGGLLLGLMINYNSLMAKHSTPLFASWVMHGIGAVTSLLFITVFSKKFSANNKINHQYTQGPLWAYFGGIPGSLTMILAAITVNSRLGLSGTLAFIIAGQVLFGLVCDIFGLFDIPKRRFALTDFFVVLSVLMGSSIIIFLK